MAFDWTCPFCSRHATLTDQSVHADSTVLTIDNAQGYCILKSIFHVCPNPKCKRFSLSLSLNKTEAVSGRWVARDTIHSWNLLPQSSAQMLPGYIPKAIVADYNEACLIKDLSPKASATLSRRCLQGIIRDFWKIKPGRLVDEIAAIQSKVDPDTWAAIEAVRTVGNIGAHMEKDIDLIVDVEPKEAELLVGLIEVLIKDWYVTRENRKNQMKALIDVAAQKDAVKKQVAHT
jgi:hypothetical protein